MLAYLWRSSRLSVLGVLVFGVASGLSSAGLVALINSTLSNRLDADLLPWLFAGLCLAILSCGFLSNVLLNRLSTRIVCDLRIQISRSILAAPFPFLQKLGKPALLAHLTEDITAIANACQLLPIICINLSVISGGLVYLSWLSWRLALVLLGVILFGVFSFTLFRRFPQHAVLKARNEYDVLSRAFQALAEGVRELKLHRLRSDAFMTHSLIASSEAHRRYSLAGVVAYLRVNQWAQFLYYSTIGCILYVFPRWQAVDKEVIGGYALVFLFMMSPLTLLTNSLPVFSRARVSLQKVRQLEEALNAQTAKADSSVKPGFSNHLSMLSLQGVTHRFHSEKENRNFTLGPVDLDFKPGELVFLIGGNGSGKTTLAMLLTGLYQPEQGLIRWNGKVVDDSNRDDYLQNFSVIFSDFYLFDELYGFDAGQDQVDDYLKRLHLNHKVKVEKGRFSSVALSQGQRKRLALLVAYLEDRPFYVFDEWAADQDPEFKHLFYTELLPALKARGKTVLAISHDDRYFYLADRCIKLEEGQIVDMEPEKKLKSSNTVWHHASVDRKRREHKNGHGSAVLWFTGLSGSGKSTLAHAIEERLHSLGLNSFVLDGDNVRQGLCGDLGFSDADRKENIRRIGEVAKLMLDAGVITLTAFISPFKAERDAARELMSQDSDFLEIHCFCPLPVCEQRDVKGLYQKARRGDIKDFTGISSPYEAPENPDLKIDTSLLSLEESVNRVLSLLYSRKLLPVMESDEL